MAEASKVKIHLATRGDFADAMEASAKTPDVDLQTPGGDEFLDPVTAVLIGTAVLALGKFIMTWWGHRRGGLVIDLRPGAPDEVHRDTDLDWYLVLIFAKDGTVKIDTKDEGTDAIERIIDTIAKGAFDSAADIAKAAASAVSDSSKVTTEATKQSPPAG